jgi:non-ribosomal peptide synthetase component E (peptide arylation enzyme)
MGLASLCGGAAPQLCAAVVQDRSLDVDELRAFAARRLPAHMSCDRVLLLDALPLTASGKVDRRALEQRFAATDAAGDTAAIVAAPDSLY